MILDRAGTSREICDSKRVRSFFWGSRAVRLFAPGRNFSPAWISSFEFPARSFSRSLSGKPGAVQLNDRAKGRTEFLQYGSGKKVLDLQKESGAQIVDDRNRFDAVGGQIQCFATVSHPGMR